MAEKEEFSLDDYISQEGNEKKGSFQKNNNGNRRFGNSHGNRFGNNHNNNNNYNNNRHNGNNGRRFGGNDQRRNYQDNNNNSEGNRGNRQTVYVEKEPVEKVIPEHKKRIVKIYNLEPSITNEEFYNLFVKYGSIEQSKIHTDKKGKSEEKGYVMYRDHDSALRAIDDLNEIQLEGRIITVEFMKAGERLEDQERHQSQSDSRDVGIINKRISKDDNNDDRSNFRKKSYQKDEDFSGKKFYRR